MTSPLFEPFNSSVNIAEALEEPMRDLNLAMESHSLWPTESSATYQDDLPFAPSPAVSTAMNTAASPAHLPAESDPVVLHTNTNCLKQLPLQREKIVARKGANFTIMLVGESGLGKSTFVNTLFRDRIIDTSQSLPLSTRAGADAYGKNTNLDIRQVEYDENGFMGHFTIVESCGFGDYTNNKSAWIPLCQYIDAQHAMYMCEEEQPHRDKLVDTRVHVCLYFVYPSGHGLLPLDIVSMQELCQRANLIPVIAKADCFTKDDLAKFKKSIQDAIAEHEITVFCPPICASDSESAPQWPYAVIASEKTVTVNGAAFRGRQYRWGVALVDDPDHCDFTTLSMVLMGRNMLDLIDTTHELHYERQRRQLMQHRLKAYFEVEQKEKEAEIDLNASLKVPRSREKKTVTFMSPVDDHAGDPDPASYTGLEVLAKIAPFGYEFLRNERLESNSLFLLRVRNARADMDRVTQMQEDHFRKWNEELLNSRESCQTELESLYRVVVGLQDSIKHLESQQHHRH